jgi:hypothetical protein
MLITESQIRQIIKEEIQAMVEEGIIDEGFADTLRRGVGQLGARLASAVGTTSADVADIEKAKASEKAAGEEKATAAKKEMAKKQVVQKAREASQALLKIDNDMRKISELSGPLSYADGTKLDVTSIGSAIEALMQELDKVEQKITGETGHTTGGSLGLHPTLKEKKAAKK